MIQQKAQIKGDKHALHHHATVIDAVDDQIIQLGNLELKKIHQQKCRDASQEQVQVAQIISVDVTSEYHTESSPLLRPPRRGQ